MEEKYALFAFNGDAMCFVHVLLNALDMNENGYVVKVIIEGSSTALIKKFHDEKEDAPFYNLYKKVANEGLIDAVCKACATKMGSIDEARAEGLPIVGDMSIHPSMSQYTKKGFEIIIF